MDAVAPEKPEDAQAAAPEASGRAWRCPTWHDRSGNLPVCRTPFVFFFLFNLSEGRGVPGWLQHWWEREADVGLEREDGQGAGNLKIEVIPQQDCC